MILCLKCLWKISGQEFQGPLFSARVGRGPRAALLGGSSLVPPGGPVHSVTPWAPSGKASPAPTGPTRLSRQNREREAAGSPSPPTPRLSRAALHPPCPTCALTLQTPPLLPPSRGHGHLGALLERHTVNLPRTQQRGPGEQPARAAYWPLSHTSRPHARGCTLTHSHVHMCPVHMHART